MEGLWNSQEQAAVEDFLALQLRGSADTIAQLLEQVLAAVEVKELMFTVDIHDPEKRRHALDILASIRAESTK
jgi:alkanesulfonate monooxygenase SsuD/methylene tetrahydromethanopterin reductase-like flavin-dependent oxidoreductase (luciferase family)